MSDPSRSVLPRRPLTRLNFLGRLVEERYQEPADPARLGWWGRFRQKCHGLVCCFHAFGHTNEIVPPGDPRRDRVRYRAIRERYAFRMAANQSASPAVYHHVQWCANCGKIAYDEVTYSPLCPELGWR